MQLGDRRVHRLGMSLSGLRTTGMWGEPASREAAIEAIRRAVELGVDVLEVPVPFGPFTDLVREAAVPEAAVAARLTGSVPGPEVLATRLGRPPDLVLAGPGRLAELESWGLPLGLVAGSEDRPPAQAVVAVRGPFPAPAGLLEWCEAQGLPYMAADTAVLGAGRWTIALPAPSGLGEVQRLLTEEAPTPPTAGPG